MPEQLSKHPEVTLQVLRSAGAKCGEGAAQEILTQCPAARFCKLPGGEVCVYGLPDAARMTQISTAEWRALLPPPAAPAPSGFSGSALALVVLAAAAAGALAGALIARRRAGRN